jgi:hypothetical protein
MKRITLIAASVLAVLALPVAPAMAQDEDMAAMMEAYQKAGMPGVPQKQLAALVGTWDAVNKFWMDPAGEPMVMTGTMEYEMTMDGRYLEETIQADFMGQPFVGHGLYAYNNATGKVEASWIDNMSTAIYRYEGSINDAGDEIVLEGKYMDPVTKEWKHTRSVMQFSGDELLYVSYDIVDGNEVKTMEVKGTRKGT